VAGVVGHAFVLPSVDRRPVRWPNYDARKDTTVVPYYYIID
jgi:hypothetical protein